MRLVSNVGMTEGMFDICVWWGGDEGDAAHRVVIFWIRRVDDRDVVGDNDFVAERQSDRRSHGVVPYGHRRKRR